MSNLLRVCIKKQIKIHTASLLKLNWLSEPKLAVCETAWHKHPAKKEESLQSKVNPVTTVWTDIPWAIYGLICWAWSKYCASISKRCLLWKDERTVLFINGWRGRKLSTILFSSSPSEVKSSIRNASSWEWEMASLAPGIPNPFLEFGFLIQIFLYWCSRKKKAIPTCNHLHGFCPQWFITADWSMQQIRRLVLTKGTTMLSN